VPADRGHTEPTASLAFSYESALATIVAAAPLGAETVALEQSIDRALADAITSPVALPPWDNAGMDGYAVRRADVAQTTPTVPCELRVVSTIAAGVDPASLRGLGAGEAARIMTGAPVPPGCDAVVRIEDTDRGEDVVRIFGTRDLAGRGNIRPLGEEIARGDQVFGAGTTVGPSHLGVMASLGQREVLVYKQPRVTILSGGDELVLLDRFDDVLAGRRIVASSTYALPALFRRAGAEVRVAPLAPDTLEGTMEAIASAIDAGCDLLVTTGGVSVGAYDYTRDALAALGGTLDFWRAKIRPGGPIGTGHVRNTRWLGLPGNPVSSMVTGALFAWPLIRTMGGHHRTSHRVLRVTMQDTFETPAALTYFARVVLSQRADGGFDARLAGPQGSNLLHTMAMADALLMVPEHRTAALPGEEFDAVVLP